ncbi:AAA family ATPase [Pseudogracilibacillus sp. SO30301A]|uniref:AAA family ATPase n=1 Tax=Pseudogracilibacillus sp. SO30301A TaxID=3098291 RepID=UPI00300DFD17
MFQQGKNNVQDIKKQVNLQRNNQTEVGQIADYLKEVSKSREVRQDIEAQKYIAEELFDLGLIEEAEKLCKRLIRRRPNDMEIQSLHTKIRHANVNSNQEDITVFEKNRRVIDRIQKGLDNKIIGLNGFILQLSNIVQRSLLNEQQLYPYKEVMLLSSKPSQGVKTTITEFFNQVYKYKLLEGDGVAVIDLAQYSSDGGNMLSTFLLDIYHAFNSSGHVTVFKNVDQCPQDLRLQMNQLVTEGRIRLDGRYHYQNGSLHKVEGMLVSGSFDSIEATDQYILFHTYGKLEDGLHIFTNTSQSKITTKLAIDPLTQDESLQLFKNFFDEHIKLLQNNLGVDIIVELYSFQQAAHAKFVTDGAVGLKLFVYQIFQKINDYFVQHADQIHAQWEIIYQMQQVCIKNEDMFVELFRMQEEGKSLKKIEKEIEELIGLEEVKQSLKELKIYLESRTRRAQRGADSDLISLHILFKGNPGTGKTTVARLLAEYLKAVGYLSEGHLIEVDRSGLVAEYIGQTATKTMGKIEAAMGGVLFIDEAYALARGGENDFGKEAIDTLVKAMDDYRGKFVVIFAGYPEEMDGLLEMNPGLQSRISHSFFFNDYTSAQMVNISELVAKSQGYVIEQRVKQLLPEHFEGFQIQGKTDSGNGRLARRVIEDAITKQAVRTMQETNLSDEELNLLLLEDFGLEEKAPFDLESELQSIIGLDHVKDMVRTLYRQELINKKRREMNPAFKHKQSLNFIFTGNPGTGKTTIARVIADLFKNIQVLKKGHLVEVSRSDLVAGYIGQTAIKTEKVFRKALGGVLFIDEAYALAQGVENDFGKEAIDTLIKLIEDYRGSVSVILAGYEDSMEKFLSMNEGINSRFTNTLHFDDYSVDELYSIALNIIEDRGFHLSDKGNEALKYYIFEYCVHVDGNGRFIRNMVEELIRVQSDRVFMENELELLTITQADVATFIDKVKS